MSIDEDSARHSTARGQKLKRVVIAGLKAVVSIGLIVFLATRLDYARWSESWKSLNVAWIAAAFAILVFETALLAGLRLSLMLGVVGKQLLLRTTAQIALCGLFFEQVTIGFVGGDAVRLWLLRRAGLLFGPAVQALLFDRAIGFAGILLLSLLGVQALMPLVDSSFRDVVTITLSVIAAGGLIGIAVFVAVSKLSPASRIANAWRRLVTPGQVGKNATALATVFVLAIATHLCNVAVFWMLGESLGLSITLYQWFIVVPTVLLVSMVPISAGGWGLREGTMVVALHALGFPAEQAILPSILFGLCVVAATIPGGILWIGESSSARKSKA